LNLKRNIILRKTSASYLKLVYILLPDFETLHIPLWFRILLLLLSNTKEREKKKKKKEAEEGKLTWFSKLEI